MPAIPNAGNSDATGTRLATCPSQADHATTVAGLPGNGQRANHEKTDPWRAGHHHLNGGHIGRVGAKNKVGPELNGIDGRKSGTAEGYSYSDANKNSGITWNKEQFLEYIKDPKAKIPGTKMIFPGIKNEKEANDVWAYLAQYDKDGKTK